METLRWILFVVAILLFFVIVIIFLAKKVRKENNLWKRAFRRCCIAFVICLFCLLQLWISEYFPRQVSQRIEIEGMGSFHVPSHWVLTEYEGLMYFTDRELLNGEVGLQDVTVFIAQWIPGTWQDRLSTTAPSTGGAYGEAIFSFQGESVTGLWLSGRLGAWRVEFVAIDESVTLQTMRNILQSFRAK